MLIDRYLPKFDVSYVCEASVDASQAETYAAIRETDIRDPVINALFALRELPQRIARRLRGEQSPPAPPVPAKITFGNPATLGSMWIVLAEESGVELVIGAVGRFWQKEYGPRNVAPAEFVPFNEPGYAKLAVGLSVRPAGTGTILHYEARTATTDDTARRTFRRYWRVIAPGVALVMRRVLRRITTQAERRVAAAA